MISENDVRDISGATVYDEQGDKIGKAGQIFLDDQTGQPEWVTVNTGFFSGRESFVPLADAEMTGDGLRIPYSKDRVKDAPNVDVDAGHLSQDEEADLYRYYGISYSESQSDSGLAAGGTTGDYDRTDTDATYAGTTGTAAVGHDTSGPTTDDAMTRSEEQINVGTRRQEAGRARLRKYVVTEQVSQTVPVSHEEVRVEREPITDANRGDALSGPEISDEEHEVVLHEERPVVEKEAVPVERVRLSKETVQGEETVSDEVRKEVIDTDADRKRADSADRR